TLENHVPEGVFAMPDPENPGRFGNRPVTTEQARKGGKASSGSFGSEQGAGPPRAGGRHSHGGRGKQ
ncbi:hypothetical protein V9111_10470, partial [Streptococcus agalactiae]|uniref:hypothetical protein n=1 Tax=Streptococcus agalactiae TaxID=1311 RepID=UPI003010040B